MEDERSLGDHLRPFLEGNSTSRSESEWKAAEWAGRDVVAGVETLGKARKGKRPYFNNLQQIVGDKSRKHLRFPLLSLSNCQI